MHRCFGLALFIFGWHTFAAAVELVANGHAVAEIVIPEAAEPSIRTAAEELQRHLEGISGAKLPIVTEISPAVSSQVYVGESRHTRNLGITLDDVRYDGFKIVTGKNHVVIAGREFPHERNSFLQFSGGGLAQGISARWRNRQKAWEEFTGRKWRFPPMHDYRDTNQECGFHLGDGTGTLYGVYELLQQLGWRWYMPVAGIGMVVPESRNISIREQNLKREPEFSQRIFTDPALGRFKDEFLWFKSMRVGRDEIMPIYHSLSGPTKLYPQEQPQEYYGIVNGKTDLQSPRLTSERLRNDICEYLKFVDKGFPGIRYACIGQPDGWSTMDDTDAAAGWDKSEARGISGSFSDYYWDFILDVRQRMMAEAPDRKFTVFAYSRTRRVPAGLEQVPENVSVFFCQTSQNWVMSDHELADREEWLNKMTHKKQLAIWEYYLLHAERYNYPPVPAIFTKQMKRNFAGLYDRCAGFHAEIPWSSAAEIARNKLSMRRPGLNHLMLYLHNLLCWDRHLDIPAVLEEYYRLFYGPAKAEMQEFFEFAEQVWSRPEPRQITATGGFLKAADVERYFAILKRARDKAGDTVYGQRIDFLAAEMEELGRLFKNLQRSGPKIRAYLATDPQIDADLHKPFWRGQTNSRYLFHSLRDMVTGELPRHVKTAVSFRWAGDALVIGIECMEPKMEKVTENCKERDALDIQADDFVEVLLETPQGIRPRIIVNPAGTVFDECITKDLADLPQWYTVRHVAVRKYADRWTVEMLIDAKTLGGGRPTPSYPWGIQVNRQRLAGNTPEYYMLSPSGTDFTDPNMGNLMLRK